MNVAAEQKPSPWERALAKFGAYFEERGLGAADIPAAIIVHEILGMVMATGAWTLCYHIRPSRYVAGRLTRIAGPTAQARMQQVYDKAMVQATQTVRKMSWVSKAAPRLDPPRLTTSLAESLCLRAAAKPATFVFKLWASYQIIKLAKHRFHNKQQKVVEKSKRRK